MQEIKSSNDETVDAQGIEQNSDAWLAWRNAGLGSSDAPIVLGISPWSTRFELWQLKLGLRQPTPPTFITDRGHMLEPRARALYEIQNGFVDFPPALVEHERYPFLRASLDGFNAELKAVLEIKAPGRKTHELAKAGEIPPHYFAQVQHQLLITGASYCDFASYWLDNEGQPDERAELAVVRVAVDFEYCQRLINEMTAFWSLVETKTPPALVDRDFKAINRKPFNDKIRQLKALIGEIRADPLVKDLERWRCLGLYANIDGLTLGFSHDD